MASPSLTLRFTAWAVLLFASGPLAGCIGRYGFVAGQPAAAGPGPARPQSKRGPLAVKLQVPNRQDSFFLSRLQELGGGTVVAADAPPTSGRFVSITVTEVPNSVGVQIWGILAAITAFIIPVYSTDSGYDLAFETFVDGKSARTYRYSVREDLYVWVLLLPAIWVNFLTRSRSDAFSDAITRFVADSKGDGF
jgi:hypothetical protein